MTYYQNQLFYSISLLHCSVQFSLLLPKEWKITFFADQLIIQKWKLDFAIARDQFKAEVF